MRKYIQTFLSCLCEAASVTVTKIWSSDNKEVMFSLYLSRNYNMRHDERQRSAYVIEIWLDGWMDKSRPQITTTFPPHLKLCVNQNLLVKPIFRSFCRMRQRWTVRLDVARKPGLQCKKSGPAELTVKPHAFSSNLKSWKLLNSFFDPLGLELFLHPDKSGWSRDVFEVIFD